MKRTFSTICSSNSNTETCENKRTLTKYFSRTNSNDVSSGPSKSHVDILNKLKVEKCPLCGCTVGSSWIEIHVNSCLDKTKQYDGLCMDGSIFDASILNSQISNVCSQSIEGLNPEHQIFKKTDLSLSQQNAFEILMNQSQPLRFEFSLLFIEGKLFPKFDVQSSRNKSSMAWTKEMKMKNIRMDIIIPDSSSKELILTISTNIDSNIKPNSVMDSNLNQGLSTSLLKSMLQKAVRRRCVRKAMRIASKLAELSLSELLRRIPIICLEDSLIHPGIPIIVWLMAAESKGFTPPPFLIDACILIVGEIAACPHRDFAWDRSVLDNFDSLQQRFCNVNDVIIVFSLLLRASYGGMPGDVDFLIDMSRTWLCRMMPSFEFNCFNVNQSQNVSSNLFSYLHPDYSLSSKASKILSALYSSYMCKENMNIIIEQKDVDDMSLVCNSYLQKTSSNNVDLQNTLRLRSEDLLIEGIDFHCDWQLLNYVQSKNIVELSKLVEKNVTNTFEEEVQDIIKSAIWTFSSSTNTHSAWPVDILTLKRFEDEKKIQLDRKKKLSAVWRLIAPTFNQYIKQKVFNITKFLQ